MRLVLVAIMIATLAGTLPAFATATLDCIADTEDALIIVHGIVPHGMGEPLLQAQAEITVELPNLGADLGRGLFEAEQQVQYWLDDVSLNVLFYRERPGNGPFGSTMLTIKTTRDAQDEEGTYRGSYIIEGSEVPASGGEAISVEVHGKIACFAG